jgi:sulfur-oxidizing protein SoxB
MTYALAPKATIGRRISDLRIGGSPLQPTKRYKVCGWAPVAPGITGEPIWDVVGRHLRARRTIAPLEASRPRLG